VLEMGTAKTGLELAGGSSCGVGSKVVESCVSWICIAGKGARGIANGDIALGGGLGGLMSGCCSCRPKEQPNS